MISLVPTLCVGASALALCALCTTLLMQQGKRPLDIPTETVGMSNGQCFSHGPPSVCCLPSRILGTWMYGADEIPNVAKLDLDQNVWQEVVNELR